LEISWQLISSRKKSFQAVDSTKKKGSDIKSAKFSWETICLAFFNFYYFKMCYLFFISF